MRVALWVFNGKRGHVDEGNTERLRQENGNHDNSDTRVGERKIGETIVQCTVQTYVNTVHLTIVDCIRSGSYTIRVNNLFRIARRNRNWGFCLL